MYRGHHAAVALRFVVAVGASLLLATPALAGEVTDENEAVEKIVIQINDEPERDPELSVGGETIEVQEGDLVTFRIAINEDQTLEGRDNVAEVKDVFKANRFEFVSAVGEFGATCTPEAPEADDKSITCLVSLDPVDGNAALRITLRALDIGSEAGDAQGCVVTTNVVSTVEPSGGDQAQVKICPADEEVTPTPTPAPTVAPTPAPTAAPELLPDTAVPATSLAVGLLAILAVTGVGGLVALQRWARIRDR